MTSSQSYHHTAIRFLLGHCLVGALAGFLFGGLLLWFDVAGLRTMIFASPDQFLFLAMLFFSLFITFGSIAMAVAVMGLGEERD